MSDPLSIASGVAGIISLAIQVAGTCYTYGCAAKGAPAEVDRLLTEIMALSGVLGTLRAVLETGERKEQEEGLNEPAAAAAASASAPGKEEEEREAMLKQPPAELPPPYSPFDARENRFKGLDEPLRGAKEALEEVQAALAKAEMRSETRAGKLLKSLKWPFKQDKTMALVGRMERYKTLFMLALATSQVDAEAESKRVLLEIRDEQCRDRLDKQLDKQDAQFEKITEWLSPVNCADAHRAATRLRLEGTGSWMLRSPKWTRWLKSEKDFLWLYGIPGSGKTILTSTLLEQCTQCTKPSEVFLAYFYCDFRREESQAPETVLGALVCQLYSQFQVIPPDFERFVKQHRSEGGKLNVPTFEELQSLLVSLVQQAPGVILIIDALDECLKREELLLLLKQLPTIEKSRVKVLVSSRQEADIETAFAGLEQQSTRVPAVDRDIDSYISSSVARSARLKRLKGELRETVFSTLNKEAHGMFRWVQCQVEALSQLRTDRDIRMALKKLPRTLYETYERILAHISDSDAVVARRALVWLAYTPRPITLTELAEAVVVDQDTKGKDPEAAWYPPDLLLVISSLATYFPDSDVIILAHHSVKEFLESPEWSGGSLKCFAMENAAANVEITCTCLIYLLMNDFASGLCNSRTAFYARCEAYPLLPYAARYWPYHAKTTAEMPQSMLDLACRLLHPSRTPNFWAWLEAVIAQGYYSYRSLSGGLDKNNGQKYWRAGRVGDPAKVFRPVPTRLTPLYYASSFGLVPVVSWLLKQPRVDINAKSGLHGGTALHAAAFRRNGEVARLLIEAGANTKLIDLHGLGAQDYAPGSTIFNRTPAKYEKEATDSENSDNGRRAGDNW